MLFGVPQGFPLGSFLFTLFITPFGDICRGCSIKFHGYADDQQIYCFVDSNNKTEIHEAIQRIESCLSSIREWMKINMLKLNDSKTEFILLGPKNNVSKLGDISMIGNVCVKSVKTGRKLGFHVSKNFAVTDHLLKFVHHPMWPWRNFLEPDISLTKPRKRCWYKL